MLKKNLIASYDLLKKNKLKAAIASLAEILFLFIFLSIFSSLFLKIMEVESEVKGVMSTSNLKELVANEALILQSYNLLIKYFLFILLTLYICWCLFQLISWISVHKAVYRINARKFILRFLGFTTFFFALGYSLVWLLFKLSQYSSLAFLNILTPGIISALLVLIILALLYLMFISYAKIDSKIKQIIKSVNLRSLGSFALILLINLASLLILIYFFIFLGRLHSNFLLLTPLIIVIMSVIITFTKIFFILELR